MKTVVAVEKLTALDAGFMAGLAMIRCGLAGLEGEGMLPAPWAANMLRTRPKVFIDLERLSFVRGGAAAAAAGAGGGTGTGATT